MNAWMDLIWKQGGNLPLTPKPIHLGGGERAVLPSFCREQIESIDYDKNEIIYKVLNPSLYPVHKHKGTIQFDYDPEKNSTRMLWHIQVTPYHNFAIPVNLFNSAVTATQSQNLRNYLIQQQQQQPGKEEDSEEEETLHHVVESHMERGFLWLLEKTVDLVNGTFAAVEDQQQAWQRIHNKRDDSVAQVILEEATDAKKVANKEIWANKETGFFFGEAKQKEQPRPTLRLRKEDIPEDLR
jgi:hypothetical protein